MKQTLERLVAGLAADSYVAVIAAIFVIVVAVNILKRYLTRYIADSQARYYARKVITSAGYFLGLIILLAVFSGRLRNISVILGVAGAGVAFSLQEVIASFAGWLAISFSSFYRVGDRVQLGGIKGDVIDVGLLRTTLMECGEWIKSDLYTGRIVRVANSSIFKEPVFNYSGDFPFLWDEITVPVKHGSDHNLARDILLQVSNETVGDNTPGARGWWEKMLEKYRIENAKIEPMVTLVVTDNWLEFSVRYVVDYKQRRVTKDRLFNRMLDEFAKTDGKVAIASTTLSIVEAPRLDVKIARERDVE